MRNETRLRYNAVMKQLAKLNNVEKVSHKFALPVRYRSGHKLTQIQKLGKIRDNSILINTICAN